MSVRFLSRLHKERKNASRDQIEQGRIRNWVLWHIVQWELERTTFLIIFAAGRPRPQDPRWLRPPPHHHHQQLQDQAGRVAHILAAAGAGRPAAPARLNAAAAEQAAATWPPSSSCRRGQISSNRRERGGQPLSNMVSLPKIMKLIECKDAQGSNSNMTLSAGCFTSKLCDKNVNLVLPGSITRGSGMR